MSRWLALCIIFFLVACEPETTPFPIEIPDTPTPVPPAVTPEPIRYALAPNTQAVVADLELIRASAQVEQLTEEANPAELSNRFDIIVTYGQIPGWTQSATPVTVALVINPLNDPDLEAILQSSINPDPIVEQIAIEGATARTVQTTPPGDLRTQLANLGRPDGFSLIIGHSFVPGTEQVADQLRTINITSRLEVFSHDRLFDALTNGDIPLGLLTWTTPEQRDQWITAFGTENVIDLFTLPVSYLATPDLTISFTPGGFPLAERQP